MDSKKDLKEILLPSVDPSFFSSAHAWETEEISPVEKDILKAKLIHKKPTTKSNKNKPKSTERKSTKIQKDKEQKTPKPKPNPNQIKETNTKEKITQKSTKKVSETSTTAPYHPKLKLVPHKNQESIETKVVGQILPNPTISIQIQNSNTKSKVKQSPRKVFVSEMKFDFDWATDDVEMDYSVMPVFK
jgi:hypothetical protein